MGRPVPSFPRGITDAHGRTGFVALGGDEVVAVDLGPGSVLWRRGEVGRPLIVTEAGLIVLQRRSGQLQFALLDPATGDLLRQIGPLPIPDWAAAEWDRPEGFMAVARNQADRPEIAWRAQRLYHGGAAPSVVIERAARADAAGLLQVDPTQGRIESLPGAGELEPPAESVATAGPDVLAATRTGERLYALKAMPTPAGTTRVTLEARETSSGKTLWETLIEERMTRRPLPLRR